MATRYLVVAEKVLGEAAVIAPATLDELGMKPTDSISVTASSTFFFTTFIVDPKLPVSQIKLPRKLAITLKEGERVQIQPADQLTQAPTPAPNANNNGAQRAQSNSNVAVAGQAPAQIKWDTISPSD